MGTLFTVTEAAVKELTRIAASENKPARVRVTMKGGGCAGMTIVMDFTKHPSDEMFDLTFTVDGVEFITDVKSAHFVQDATLDFGGSILDRGFKWQFPKATGGCGCGTSFAF